MTRLKSFINIKKEGGYNLIMLKVGGERKKRLKNNDVLFNGVLNYRIKTVNNERTLP